MCYKTFIKNVFQSEFQVLNPQLFQVLPDPASSIKKMQFCIKSSAKCIKYTYKKLVIWFAIQQVALFFTTLSVRKQHSVFTLRVMYPEAP